MTLHPILIAFFFLVFALLAIPPLLTYLRKKQMGLALLMVITIVTFGWSAWIAGHV